MTELEKKVLKACEYMENGDPLKDVLDDYEVMEAIELLGEYIKDYYAE
jgi:hypothetical protein